MATHQCPNCSYKSTHRWAVKRHMASQHGVAQAGVERSVKPQQPYNQKRPYNHYLRHHISGSYWKQQKWHRAPY